MIFDFYVLIVFLDVKLWREIVKNVIKNDTILIVNELYSEMKVMIVLRCHGD